MPRKPLPVDVKKREVRVFLPPIMMMKLDEMVNKKEAASRSEAVRLLLASSSGAPPCPYSTMDERGTFVCNYHDSSPGDCDIANCPVKRRL